MIKKEIMAYITALADVVGDGVTISTYNSLKNLLDFVADLNEEVNSDSEAIYVKRIIELQNEVETLHNQINESVAVVLDESKEMQELKSKLAESENVAEYSNSLWNSVYKKLALENEKLSKELLFREVK